MIPIETKLDYVSLYIVAKTIGLKTIKKTLKFKVIVPSELYTKYKDKNCKMKNGDAISDLTAPADVSALNTVDKCADYCNKKGNDGYG